MYGYTQSVLQLQVAKVSELCAGQNYFGSLVMGIYSEMNLNRLMFEGKKYNNVNCNNSTLLTRPKKKKYIVDEKLFIRNICNRSLHGNQFDIFSNKVNDNDVLTRSCWKVVIDKKCM
jgi:hypothetical protein